MKKFIFWLVALLSISGFSQTIGVQFTIDDGLISNSIGEVFLDHAGNLWIGTQYGLSKKTGNQFTNYTVSDGLPDNTIYAFAEDAAGNLYIGSYGAAKFDGTNFTVYDSLSGKTVTTILVDHNQHIWFGTYSDGIYVYDGVNWTHYQNGNEITLIQVYALYEDANNIIYAGGLSGDYEINIFQNGIWTHLTTDTVTSGKRIYCFSQDDNGTVWASGLNNQGSYFLEFTGGTNFYIFYVDESVRSSGSLYKGEFIFTGPHQIVSTAVTGLLFHDFVTGQNAVINQYNYFRGAPVSLAKENNDLWIGTISDGLILLSDIQDFIPHDFYEYLDVNNWSVRFNSMGDLFWNPLVGKSESYIPKDSLKSTLFLGNLWIGGLDSLDSLHFFGERYNPNTETWAGPLANNYDSYAYYNKYNRLWKVSKSEIDYHRNHYNDVGYHMPEDIENWPGNGDTTNGEFPIMAPFADMNGNNIYEPEQGDYPLIRGDQAVYFIYNDARIDTHSTSGGMPLGFEIHAMAYAYQDIGCLNNTFFINYQIFNRSDINYHDVYSGLYSDFDIGNPADDFTGCDSTKNLFYGYNGDDDDNGAYGYGFHPPAQGIMFLNQTMTHFGFLFGYSDIAQDLYDLLQFQYQYNYSGNPVHYLFELHSGHTEEEIGNMPDDIRGVGSVGPFTLNAGDYICVDIAFPWARTDTGSAYQSLLDLLQDADEVQDFYDQQGYVCSLTQSVPHVFPPNANVLIYPNPTAGNLTIETTNIKNYQVAVFSLLGQKLITDKNVKQINIGSLPKEIYIVKISSDKINYTQQIVLQ